MSHTSEGRLHAYVDGASDAAETATIEAHVAGCDDCARRLDNVRAAAAEATALLGGLEPGPIHAPAFEELAARAAERDVGSEGGVASAGGKVVSVPFWRHQALAWAAMVVTAFGLGWLSRSEIGVPVELRPELDRLQAQQLKPENSRAEPDPLADQLAVSALDEIAELDDTRKAGAGVAGAERNVPVSKSVGQPAGSAANEAVGDQKVQEEVPAAAPAAPLELERRAAPQPTTVAPPEPAAEQARRKAAAAAGLLGADVQAAPPRANEPADEGQARAGAFRSQSEAESFEENAALGRGSYFAATGYVTVPPVEAELWLGMPLRELPDLVRLRTEVGPGALFADSAVGLPVIRMVYQDATGKEIVLTQQYLGDAAARPEERPAARREVAAGGRLDDRARDVAAGPPPAADRDELIASGFLETLPVIIVETSGRRIYRWFDGTGYLLSVSGMIDEDVLRSLAEQVR